MTVRRGVAACAAGLGACAVAFAACAAPGVRPGPPLVNPGFEEGPIAEHCAPGWHCAAHSDPASFRFAVVEAEAGSGRRSFCIAPVKREPWGKASQVTRSREIAGRRVRFSMALRMEDVTGAGAGALVVTHGGAGQILGAQRTYVTGTHGWQRVAVEIDVPPAFSDLEMAAVLEGKGRACFDDARLEVLQ